MKKWFYSLNKREQLFLHLVFFIFDIFLIIFLYIFQDVETNQNIYPLVALCAVLFLVTTIVEICFICYTVMNKNKGEFNNQEINNSDNNYTTTNTTQTYFLKSYVSNNERMYFDAIKEAVGDKYFVYPQICLASIIDKHTDGYRNELFRIVDFGIFDKNFNLILLIEINDSSHNSYERQIRDKKVLDICFKAGIPIIAFWTSQGFNKDLIIDKISKCTGINSLESNKNISDNKY